MHYQRAYQFVFQNPQWPLNLVVGSACLVLPVVGWGMFLGYLLEVMDNLRQSDRDYPSFDIDRVGHYLTRGLVPTLVQLVLFAPVFLLAGIGVVALATSSEPGRGPSHAARLLASLLPPAIVVVTLLLSFLVLPWLLYLGVGAQRSVASGWRFAQGFLKLVWLEALLAQGFVIVTGLALFFLGLLPCGLGSPPALALAGFAQFHLLGQLYALYLQRGGQELAGQSLPA
jgi:hypothetical protein